MVQIRPVQPKLQPFECVENGNNKKSDFVTEERMYHLLGVLCGDHNRVNFQLQKQGSVVRMKTRKRATLSQQSRMYHLLRVLCGADNSVNF
jgi:hypothetical protein